jgi:hypothetical protein
MKVGDIVWVDLSPRPRKWLAVILASIEGGTYYDVLVRGKVMRLHECWLAKGEE